MLESVLGQTLASSNLASSARLTCGDTGRAADDRMRPRSTMLAQAHLEHRDDEALRLLPALRISRSLHQARLPRAHLERARLRTAEMSGLRVR